MISDEPMNEVCICMHIYIYICNVRECKFAFVLCLMYVCIHTCMYVCIHGWMISDAPMDDVSCMYVCMYVCMYMEISGSVDVFMECKYVYIQICLYINMYIDLM